MLLRTLYFDQQKMIVRWIMSNKIIRLEIQPIHAGSEPGIHYTAYESSHIDIKCPGLLTLFQLSGL
jgi:hypothetical protein